MIEVVAAVIKQRDLYLVAQRPAHKHHGGLWEFPGGKLLAQESLEAAIRRELQEELGLDKAQVLNRIQTLEADSIRLHFISVVIEQQPYCREHTAIRWCTLEALRNLVMCPLDTQFVASL